MIVDDKLWSLIHEYKLVQTQAQVHLSNNRIDEYIDCIDMLVELKRKIVKRWSYLERKIIIFVN